MVVTYAAFPVVTSPVCLPVRLASCNREVEIEWKSLLSKVQGLVSVVSWRFAVAERPFSRSQDAEHVEGQGVG